MQSNAQRIMESGVVAVIRGAKQDDIVPIAQALRDGGVITLEITMETPGVLAVIEQLRGQLGDEIIVGAGTVLDPESARAAILAGAQFIFSPTVNVDSIKMAKRYGVVSIPGALTPTEILTAYESGADLIKVFPANHFGPSYLKDIHGPLPHIPLMPTGGIGAHNAGEYIQNGAVAVGVGTSLVNTKLPVNDETLQSITDHSQQLVQAVQKARQS